MIILAWDDIYRGRPLPPAGSFLCIEGTVFAVFVEVQERIADHDDPRICGRCQQRIGYARTGRRLTDNAIVHITFDCTKN
jgi:hypothetical protein